MKSLNRNPSTLPTHALRKEISLFIRKQNKVITFFLGKKRAVFLTKYEECQETRRDKSRRYAVFFPCIELLKTSNIDDVNIRGKSEWELIGMCPDSTTCAVHIREETVGKDRFLFLISTFEKT